MFVSLVPLLALLAGPRAEPIGPAFTHLPSTCRADLLVDVTLPPSVDLPVLVDALTPVGLPVIVLARPAQLEGFGDVLDELEATGGEAGLWLHWPRDITEGSGANPAATWSRLRTDRRDLRRATGRPPRAVGSSHLPPGLEGSLDVFGFSLLLPAPDGLTGAPRRTVDLRGLEAAGVVIHPVQAKARDAEAGPNGGFGPLLDRTAQALEASDPPVVRLTIAAPVVLRHAETLERWRREVLEPCGAAVISRPRAEDAVRAWIRELERAGSSPYGEQSRGASSPTLDPLPTVDSAELKLLAEQLACSTDGGATLPKRVGDLDLSQAWLALASALDDHPPPLGLHSVLAPQSSPRSVLPSVGVTLPADTLRLAAGDLAPGPGQQIPSFARIGDHALTAAEALCAMAGAVLGQDPVQVTRTYSPEPYAPGLGWGGAD